MFLYTIEYVDLENCDCSIENRLYAKKQTALNYMADTKIEIEKSIKNGTGYEGLQLKLEEHNENGKSDVIVFTQEGEDVSFFNKHITLKVEEIEVEDYEPMFTAQDFMKEEISDIFETTTDKNSADYDEMLNTLAENAMCDDHLWDDMNADLLEIMRANPDYEKLAQEYEDQISIQGGF